MVAISIMLATVLYTIVLTYEETIKSDEIDCNYCGWHGNKYDCSTEMTWGYVEYQCPICGETILKERTK